MVVIHEMLTMQRCDLQLYRLFQGLVFVKIIKVSRLRKVGRVMRMHENDTIRKTLLVRPFGKLGISRTRFFDNIEEDLRTIGVRGWRRQRALDGDDSVSYTHLDVYKRQGYRLEIRLSFRLLDCYW